MTREELRDEKNRARPDIWRNNNGTWSHHRDAKREWSDRIGCAVDLRFHYEWERAELVDD